MADAPKKEVQKGDVHGKWDELEPLFEKHGLNPEYCIARLKEVIDLPLKCTVTRANGDVIQQTDPNASKAIVKAIELWAKLSGYKPPERIFVNPLNGLVLRIESEDEKSE